MHKETGEVKMFGPGEEFPDDKWVLIPDPGTEIEFTFKQKLKGGVRTTRRRRAKVVEVQEGKPGKLLIEMLSVQRD